MASETDEREVRVDELKVGDRVRIDGANGIVKMIHGPHGPLGSPPTADWYTLRVLFDEDAGLVGHGVHETVVGPRRGAKEVLRYA